ncbi:MAG: hydantoinase/oxoprolinase family protein, partial [Anaerolineae bacterium]|nr:hydantoinase/oxoprolinase family protein [Anaerolineae bacterium]
LLARVQAEGGQVNNAIHGTTLITNALIERKGSRTALITTSGFSDTLDTMKEMRYDIYDLKAPPVFHLVPRALRYEVDERLDAFGQVYHPLQVEALSGLDDWLTAKAVQAVAVCFLHAYRNPQHELLLAGWLRDHFPALSVSLSHEVAPEIREYERMSTTVCNAYVQPLTESYLNGIQTELAQEGFEYPLYLMLSSGGITIAETAARFPVRLVESGPAAGALVTAFYGQKIGEPNLVSFDMGGTTAKMCLIKNGQPYKANTFEVARVHRFKMGSGLPIRVPTIELIEIGAGGGSIAHIDEMGLLKVGPESAGADPGPACYGLGGTQPTVTDADALLGYLNPDYFLGGRMELDRAQAEAAMRTIAEPLGMSITEAAYGVYQVVNENMISATRVHLSEHGEDPRRLKLMAFGGAGPVHAHQIARALKMQGYVCPTSAGVASALGFLTAPTAFDFARTFMGRLTQPLLATLDSIFAEMMEEGKATLARAGVPESDMRFIKAADLRHVGQGHEITVTLPDGPLADISLDDTLRQMFYSQYEVIYGHAHRHLGLEVMTLRLTATSGIPNIALPTVEEDPTSVERAVKGHRRAYFADLGGFVEAPVYDRYALKAGATFAGPAIVEEKDSTAVIGPLATVRVDKYQNLVVTLEYS